MGARGDELPFGVTVRAMDVARGLCAGLRPAPYVRAFGPHLVCEVRLWLGLVRLRLGLG